MSSLLLNLHASDLRRTLLIALWRGDLLLSGGIGPNYLVGKANDFLTCKKTGASIGCHPFGKLNGFSYGNVGNEGTAH